jgi:hypothetical protein
VPLTLTGNYPTYKTHSAVSRSASFRIPCLGSSNTMIFPGD